MRLAEVRRGDAFGFDYKSREKLNPETRGDSSPTSFVVYSASTIQKRRKTLSQIAWTALQDRLAQKVFLCSRSTPVDPN